MFIMGKIGQEEYYSNSEQNQFTPKKLEDYLNSDAGNKAEIVSKYCKQYSKENFSDLFNGINPLTKKPLIKKWKDHKPGYDIVHTQSKAYSILYSAASPELRKKLDLAYRNELKKLIEKEFTKRIYPSCKKEKYRKNITKVDINYAIFQHIENRNVDPHVHNHITLFNFAEFTYKDGTKKTLAIDPQKLFADQKLMSALMDQATQRVLKDLDIKSNLTENGLEIAGISKETEELFSARKQEVLNFIKEQEKVGNKFSSYIQAEEEMSKAEYAIFKEKLRKGTAKDKEELNYNEIIKIQQDKLSNANISFNQILKENLTSKLDIGKPELLTKTLFNTNAICTKTELLTQLVRLSNGKVDIEKIDFKKLDEKFGIVQVGEDLYTTRELIRKSFETTEIAKSSQSNKINVKSGIKEKLLIDLQKKHKFNNGQLNAIDIVSQGKQITLIEGDAGTGKTSSVIKYSAEFYKLHGFEVIGLATQGKTSKALTEANIEKTYNLAEYFQNSKKPKNKLALIVDEAGMVGTEHYHQLLQYSKENNIPLLFVGDDKQLASVGYGSSFKAIKNVLNAENKARLNQNCRQTDPTQKLIAESFRDKNVNVAIKTLMNNQALIQTKSKDIAIASLVRDYLADNNKDKIVLAFKNADVNAINDQIRTKLMQQPFSSIYKKEQFYFDVITSQTVRKPQTRAFCENDKIILTGKLKLGIGKHVDNGTEAVITKIENGKVYCKSKDKEFCIDTVKFNKFNHAYCITTHKSQGLTVENSYVFSDGSTNSNQAYVDFSRHKNQVKLYIESENLEKFITNASKSCEKVELTELKEAEKIYKEMVIENEQNYSKIVKLELEIYKDENCKNFSKFDKNDISKIVEKLKDDDVLNKDQIEKLVNDVLKEETKAELVRLENFNRDKIKLEQEQKIALMNAQNAKKSKSLTMRR